MAVRERVEELVARYERIPILGIGFGLVRRDLEAGGSLSSSAIAFRLFLFFVPLLLFAVGCLGLVGRYGDPSASLDDTGITGGLGDQIKYAFQQSGRAPLITIGLGLFGMLLAGRSLSKVLVAASCSAWRLPISAKAPWKVVGAIAGLVSGMGLVALIVNKVRVELGLGLAGVSLGFAFVAYGIAWLLVSLLVPRKATDPSVLLPGAVVVAGVITGMHAISQLYLPDRFVRADALYGAIGATVVTLGWFFILGRAIVISMELDAVVYERYGTIAQAVASLPGVRAVVKRSVRVRRMLQPSEAVTRGADPSERSGSSDY